MGGRNTTGETARYGSIRARGMRVSRWGEPAKASMDTMGLVLLDLGSVFLRIVFPAFLTRTKRAPRCGRRHPLAALVVPTATAGGCPRTRARPSTSAMQPRRRAVPRHLQLVADRTIAALVAAQFGMWPPASIAYVTRQCWRCCDVHVHAHMERADADVCDADGDGAGDDSCGGRHVSRCAGGADAAGARGALYWRLRCILIIRYCLPPTLFTSFYSLSTFFFPFPIPDVRFVSCTYILTIHTLI
jgi:hypothetical protein